MIRCELVRLSSGGSMMQGSKLLILESECLQYVCCKARLYDQILGNVGSVEGVLPTSNHFPPC